MTELETQIQALKDEIAKEHTMAEALGGSPLAEKHDRRAMKLYKELRELEQQASGK